jgi:hypothetical protein
MSEHKANVASFVDAARAIARASLAQLSTADQGNVMQRLERDALPGTTPPRVLVTVEMSQAAWRLEVRAGGSRPVQVCEVSGVSALPSAAATGGEGSS